MLNSFSGFEILAFPCNQFAWQEPGTNEEIQETACTRFKAEFPIFDKVFLFKKFWNWLHYSWYVTLVNAWNFSLVGIYANGYLKTYSKKNVNFPQHALKICHSKESLIYLPCSAKHSLCCSPSMLLLSSDIAIDSSLKEYTRWNFWWNNFYDIIDWGQWKECCTPLQVLKVGKGWIICRCNQMEFYKVSREQRRKSCGEIRS